jgi:membrane-associated phospholipid phosphatase
MAGAASRVLAYLFPERTDASYDDIAQEAAESRVVAGTNYRSDVEAGLALGREVAARVIAQARTDGSEDHGGGDRPRGRGVWAPPPGAPDASSQPVEPLAGHWRTWVPGLTQKVRPAPPPAYGSPEFVAQATEVRDIGHSLTQQQKDIATHWAAGAGSSLPPGLWNEIAVGEVARAHFSIPRVVRAFALLNVAEADAGVAAWDAKYTYWSARPVNAIRDLGLDPNFKPFLPTPIFPSYISGHSTYSSAAAEVLSYLLPDGATRYRAMAQEAGISRIYGGIHYKADNEVGLQVGAQVGRMVVELASHDGAT